MTYDQISPPFRQALGTHEGFRKLGFRSDDIYVHRNPDGEMFVVLQADGKQYAVTVGWVEGLSKEEWESLWVETVCAVRDGRIVEDTLDRIWRESLPFQRGHEFILGILQKGIKIPNLQERLH